MWSLVMLVSALYLGTVSSHVCLLSPRQRGLLDVSKPGSSTCFHHTPPCGGQPVENPGVSYTVGEAIFIKWQQNFNHYEPGYPGYMDVSIADSVTSTNFTTLAVVADKYVFAQDFQENYTAVIKVPNMVCNHCVIRVRYNAHKPGETTFLQCADVQIKQAPQKPNDTTLRFLPDHTRSDKRKLLPFKKAMNLRQQARRQHGELSAKNSRLYGFSYTPFQSGRSQYVSVDAMGGAVETVLSLPFGIDSPSRLSIDPRPTFMVDSVVAVDYDKNTTSVLLNIGGDREAVAKRLYMMGNTNGSLVQEGDLFMFSGGALNALSWYTYGTSAAFRIQPAEDAGSFYFEAGIIADSAYEKRASIPKPEDLYVNFQWFETDINNYKQVYALLGNENAPDQLNARIYKFDLFNGKFVGSVELDVSEYTFMAVHSYPGSESLFAFSPGLWGDESHAWTLVAVDPVTGHVTKKCSIAPPGIFQRYYGGSVTQGNSNNGGMLQHVLRVEGSEADFIVSVNPVTCAMAFSKPTNLRHVHSMQRVDPGQY